MLQTRSPRTFESLIGDTTDYISQVWKHFIPTMLRVNVIYILSACIMVYILYTHKTYYYNNLMEDIDALSTFSISSIAGLYDNIPLGNMSAVKIAMISLLGIVLLVTGVIFLLFTPVYMILHNRYSRVPTYDEVISYMSSHIGRIVAYCLWTVLLYVPVIILSIIVAIPLCIIIIGIPVVVIYVIVLKMILSMSLYVYMDDDSIDYFNAISLSWEKIKEKFWINVASCVVIGIISSIAIKGVEMTAKIINNINVVAIDAYDAVAYVFVYSVMYLIISILYDVMIGIMYFSSGDSKNELHLNNIPRNFEV
ncbi:MAG: hypothetical protein J6C80_04950 [Flavobacteriales bacterium]|nr:hypothetical protein [Flavobacteriales bacterium]